MASADVDMGIHVADELLRPGQREPPPPPSQVWYYQATEVLPPEKGQLHELLQKQPAVLGVRGFTRRTSVSFSHLNVSSKQRWDTGGTPVGHSPLAVESTSPK